MQLLIFSDSDCNVVGNLKGSPAVTADTVSLSGCYFTGATAGALVITGESDNVISDTQFVRNSATNGGAIYVRASGANVSFDGTYAVTPPPPFFFLEIKLAHSNIAID